MNSHVEFQHLYPTYVFGNPVLGGQASIGMGGLIGGNTTPGTADRLTRWDRSSRARS